MIVNVIEIFTEYLSIMLCLYKVAKKKVSVDIYFFGFAVLNLLSVLISHTFYEECGWLMLIVYLNFMIYVKLRLTEKWIDTIKIYGIMLIAIPSLQLLFFFFVKFLFNISGIAQNELLIGILVNCIICILMMLWKEEYILKVADRLKRASGLIILMIFFILFFYILYTYNQFNFIYKPMIIQTLAGIIGFGIIFTLWVNAEEEKKRKVKEVQLYELYNKTFEEAIAAIRIRQHEFDNHINAIKCLQLTTDNTNELIKKQNEYCEKLLNDNSFNKLLKLYTEPILTGFLYSKFMNAKEQDINVIYEIHAVQLKNKIEVNVLIEIMGIFIDNAVEALLNSEDSDKILIVKILQEDTKKISIEVANRSRKYLNSEIEKFSVYGYSTKGKNHGIGLSRVKEIVKMYKADFYIENVSYNGNNFLSFKILFNK